MLVLADFLRGCDALGGGRFCAEPLNDAMVWEPYQHWAIKA
jgi:hypothetical protein